VQFTHSFAITDTNDKVSGNMETGMLYTSRNSSQIWRTDV